MRDPGTEILPKHKLIVRLILHHMANANKLRILRELMQLSREIGRSEIDPPHNTFDDVIMRSKFQQPARFFKTLPGLHRNGSLKALSLEQWPQISRQKIPLQHSHLAVDPPIILPAVFPEVLMCIQAYGHSSSQR